MNTQTIIVGLVALIVGATGGYFATWKTATPEGYAMYGGRMMHGENYGGMWGEMDAMMQGLEGKSGDEFDKAFLAEMIMHHQGAVVMAEAALVNAEHEEIKTMANAIISAQTTEIKQMRDWQKAWYGQ
jgi:uncharacterized protein (DUF305 family)